MVLYFIQVNCSYYLYAFGYYIFLFSAKEQKKNLGLSPLVIGWDGGGPMQGGNG